MNYRSFRRLHIVMDLMQYWGWVKSQYRKFILLTAGRTGSTMLMDCLSQNSSLIVRYEVFNPDAERPSGIWYRLWLSDPIRYLNLKVFGFYPATVKAVGFSIHYYHCLEGQQKLVWDFLAREEVRVIHLTRNWFQAYVSGCLARSTGIWHAKQIQDVSSVNEKQIHVDVNDLLAFLDRTQNWSDQYRQLFHEKQLLEVRYEDLIANLPAQLNQIQLFLGVNPVISVPITLKQVQKPYPEIITNFSEVEAALHGSRWQALLDEGL